VHAMTFLSTHSVFPSSSFAFKCVFSCVDAWIISICDVDNQLEACRDRFCLPYSQLQPLCVCSICVHVCLSLCSNGKYYFYVHCTTANSRRVDIIMIDYLAVNRALFFYLFNSVEHQLAIQCLEHAANCTRHWDHDDNKL